MGNNDWKVPFNLAIGMHVLLALFVIYLPHFFYSRPILPEIYTVNLVNISTSKPKAAPTRRKVAAAKPVVKIKPVKIKQEKPIKREIAPAQKAISLNPLKRKLENEAAYNALINERIRELQLQEKREQELKRKKRLERIHRERIAASIRAEQEAEQAAKEAADELKQLIHSTASTTSTTGPTGNHTNQTTSNEGPVEKAYFAAISNRIQQFWALPELGNWDPSITAIVLITINKDGTISNQSFQKRSGDKFFDQYVEKTLQQAAPLPQIPAALGKSQLEIGLVFKPNGLQNNNGNN